MTQLDAISFFVMILFLSIFISTGLWNISVRKTSLRPLPLSMGLLFVATWMFFVTGVLVLLEAFRNMVEPGLWQREMLFRGMESGIAGAEMPIGNLLCGWFLFPLRQWSHVAVSWEGIAVGLVTLCLVLFVVEMLGRRILKALWRSHWTATLVFAFIWLDVMTYCTVALVRHVAWML